MKLPELGIVLYRSSEAAWLRQSAAMVEHRDPERARIWLWLAAELDAKERQDATLHRDGGQRSRSARSGDHSERARP